MVLMKLYKVIFQSQTLVKQLEVKVQIFNVDLKIGDEIQFTNDGSTDLQIIQNITSQLFNFKCKLVLHSSISSSIATRRRAKLQDTAKEYCNIPNWDMTTVKTLKTTTNSGQTDTNFKVRRQFQLVYHQMVTQQISAGTNETFFIIN